MSGRTSQPNERQVEHDDEQAPGGPGEPGHAATLGRTGRPRAAGFRPTGGSGRQAAPTARRPSGPTRRSLCRCPTSVVPPSPPSTGPAPSADGPGCPPTARRLEEAARRAMSRRGFAYVAGSAGGEATARANRTAFDRWQVVPRVLVDTAGRDLGVDLFGRRHATPAARVADRGALGGARRRRPRRRPRCARAGRHPGAEHAGLGADGAGRRRARRFGPLVPAVLEPRRRPRREPGAAGPGVRQRGARRHARHGLPRLASTRPRPGPPAVRPGRGHRPVHLRPRVPPARRRARRRAGRRRARAAAAADPGGRADPGVAEPQPPGRHPPQPRRTGAPGRGRDVPRRVLRRPR